MTQLGPAKQKHAYTFALVHLPYIAVKILQYYHRTTTTLVWWSALLCLWKVVWKAVTIAHNLVKQKQQRRNFPAHSNIHLINQVVFNGAYKSTTGHYAKITSQNITFFFFRKLNIHKTWFKDLVKNSKYILLSTNIFYFCVSGIS